MTIYFSLGTNLGDKERNLRSAVQLISKRIGRVISLSAFLATEPWGFQSSNSFLNAACAVEVDASLLPPGTANTPEATLLAVLRLTQQIECELGRTRKSADGHYHDRLIDIDLLLAYHTDGTSIRMDTPELRLPHPLMHQRDFVMIPLRELLKQPF